MKALNKILVPIDLSESSVQIVQQAIEIANRCHAQIILLHVYSRPLFSAGRNKFFEKNIIQTLERKILQWRDQRVQARFGALVKNATNVYDIKLTSIKTRGLLIDKIKETIKTYGVDLVVMSTGKRRDIWDQKVARLSSKIKIPLLILPFKSEIPKPAKIAFAYDLKSISDFEKLNVLKIFSSVYKAEIHIFTVKDSETFSKGELAKIDRLRLYFNGYSLVFHSVKHSDVEKGILQCLHKYQISMITVLHRSRNIIEKMIHKSITKRIALNSDVPVLTLDEH